MSEKTTEAEEIDVDASALALISADSDVAGADEGESLIDEPKAKAAPVPDPEPEPEPEPEAEAAPEPKESDPDGPRDSDDKRLNRLFKRAREKEREADRAAQQVAADRAAVERAKDELDAERKALSDRAGIVDAFREDPMGGVVAVARALGTDPGELYKMISERMLSGGAMGATEQATKLAEWEKKLDEKLAALEAKQNQGAADARTQALVNQYRQCLTVNNSPEVGKHWPHLFEMAPDEYELALERAFDAADRDPAVFRQVTSDLPSFLTDLDAMVKARYEERARRKASISQAASEPDQIGEAGNGKRESDPQATRRTSRASRGKPLTNDDTAQSGSSRPLSEHERNTLSDEIARSELGII